MQWKSRIWIAILCSETALACFLAIAIATRSYGLPAQSSLRPTSGSGTRYLPPPLKSIEKLESIAPINTSTNSMRNATSPTPRTETTSNSMTGRETATKKFATWYSRESCLKESGQAMMSNGKPLRDNTLTCALWITNSLGKPLKPDGRLVKIINVQTGQSVLCAWTDSGPGRVPRSRGVVCDLTPAALRKLAGEDGIRAGRVEITVEGL